MAPTSNALRRSASFLFAAALALAAAAPARATSLVPLNLARIVEGAESAFVGEVVEAKAVQAPGGWAERISVRVSEPVFGQVEAGQVVSWLQFRFDGRTRLPGMPLYREGAEYLVFLTGKGRGTEFQLACGLGQGSFQVHRGEDGQAWARNEFRNANLWRGLDAGKVAEASAQRDPAFRALPPEQKALRVGRIRDGMLRSRQGASGLGELAEAARTLKAFDKPSERFASAPGAGGRRAAAETAPDGQR
jgi:hypothetical protein